MPLSQPQVIFGAEATPGLFGGNVLASRGSLTDNSYDAAIADLGVTTLRFPGGSLTEYLFDINNPDAPTAYDSRYGTTEEMISLTEFMGFAADEGHPVTIVLPTQTQLSQVADSNGDRWPVIDEDALRGFVQDVASGVYGDAEVRAFEIGNEYWGSGLMTAGEYGRLAAEMSLIVDDALDDIGASNIDVLVQKGNNFGSSRISEEYTGVQADVAIDDINERYDLEMGQEAIYDSGQVNWTYVNNQIILDNFDTEAEREALDGVIAHVYSRGTTNPIARTFDLENINDTWRAEMPELDVYVTEWNQKSTQALDREEDYGLFQAHEMLNIMEEFMRLGVTEANVWPLIQNTNNALSTGFSYDEATVGGEMFAMMAETLPGKTLLDFTPADNDTTEQSIGDVDVHAFAGEGELALFIVNTERDDATMTDVDISSLVAGFGAADVTRLGVMDGEASGSNRAAASTQDLAVGDVIEDGFINADLMPGEILQIVLSDVQATAAFRPVWNAANGPAQDGDSADLPTIPIQEDIPEADVDEISFEDAGGGDALGMGLMVLPLLALLGAFAG